MSEQINIIDLPLLCLEIILQENCIENEKGFFKMLFENRNKKFPNFFYFF